MQKKGVALGRMRRPSLVHDIECAQRFGWVIPPSGNLTQRVSIAGS